MAAGLAGEIASALPNVLAMNFEKFVEDAILDVPFSFIFDLFADYI